MDKEQIKLYVLGIISIILVFSTLIMIAINRPEAALGMGFLTLVAIIAFKDQ